MSVNYFNMNKLFYFSLIFGVVIWFCVFVTLPVQIVESIQPKTILFIVACYLSLILGYVTVNFKKKKTEVYNQIELTSILYQIIIITALSFLVRYIDLFFVREMSLSNSYALNRSLVGSGFEFVQIPFKIASVLKALYFFPIVIVISLNLQNKRLKIFSSALLFLPLVEALLLGSRKPFFESVIILVFTIFIFSKVKKRITVFLYGVFFSATLLTVTKTLLFKRANDVVSNSHEYVLTARYNDFLPLKKHIHDYILDEGNSEFKRNLLLTLSHIGQYTNHGLFEFNHIIANYDIPLTKGAYTFNPIAKIISNKSVNPSVRKYVYITTFGGLFLDFGWLTPLFMFVFGGFQKFVFLKAKNNFIWLPLVIYIIIINVFLLMFNYLRGAGIYPFVAFTIILLLIKNNLIKVNEESINS